MTTEVDQLKQNIQQLLGAGRLTAEQVASILGNNHQAGEEDERQRLSSLSLAELKEQAISAGAKPGRTKAENVERIIMARRSTLPACMSQPARPSPQTLTLKNTTLNTPCSLCGASRSYLLIAREGENHACGSCLRTAWEPLLGTNNPFLCPVSGAVLTGYSMLTDKVLVAQAFAILSPLCELPDAELLEASGINRILQGMTAYLDRDLDDTSPMDPAMVAEGKKILFVSRICKNLYSVFHRGDKRLSRFFSRSWTPPRTTSYYRLDLSETKEMRYAYNFFARFYPEMLEIAQSQTTPEQRLASYAQSFVDRVYVNSANSKQSLKDALAEVMKECRVHAEKGHPERSAAVSGRFYATCQRQGAYHLARLDKLLSKLPPDELELLQLVVRR